MEHKPLTCLILAAGYATRLYPLTENFPKPLLPVAGKAILDWLVDDLETGGQVERYIVVTNHKFAMHFIEWAGKRKEAIIVCDDGTETNETRLGAVCDIQYAIEQCKIDSDLLVIAGDNLLDFSLNSFIFYAQKKNACCIMRYEENDIKRLQKSGVIELGEDDSVISMEEKPQSPNSHFCVPPFYYYDRDSLMQISDAINDGCPTDAPGSLASWLARDEQFFAMEMPGKRYDIGTAENYHDVCDLVAKCSSVYSLK